MRVTVVGAGIVGLATSVALADAGADVRCLESATPMGARSAGSTRIFRLAHGDPALVDLAARARGLWAGWSRRAGRPLVGRTGTVVTGPRVEAWAAAMAAADAAHHVGEDPGLLPGPASGPVLHDPGGGVLDLAGTGAFLRSVVEPARGHVVAVDADATVVFSDGTRDRADAVVVAAGAATPGLVAPLGVELPAELEHHTRCAFAPRRGIDDAPCWLDGVTRGVLASTYQHRTAEGHWAVGGHLPDADTAWELGADEVARRSREALVTHVVEHLPHLHPEPVAALRCVPTRGVGDGVHLERAGAVHVVHGDNLAKLAPVLGELVAAAVVGDTTVGHRPADHAP